MKKKFKTGTKALAIFLTLLLFLQVLPMQVFAENLSQTPPITDASVQNLDNASEKDISILYEITEKRDAYTKVYKKSDGTYTAMISSVPMHYEQDGKWFEIDNTLQVKNKKLENVNKKFHVSFPETLHDAPVLVFSDTYQLSFSLVGAKNSKAKVKEKKSSKTTKQTPADVILDKLSATVIYKDVWKHTDLEYVLREDSVKENIIIQKASAALESYCFYLTADGLTGTIGENGEVIFCNAENMVIFKIPAPIMIDAKNAVSKNIAVELSSNESGGYTLQYTPSAEWLQDKDRKYPVKLDPAVEEAQAYSELRTMVSSSYPNENFYEYYSDLEILPEDYWMYSDMETYLYPLPKDSSLPAYDIYNVTLCMRGQVNGILGAYAVTDEPMSWKPQDITYETRPQTETDPFDYYYSEPNFYEEGSWVNFDLTRFEDTDWFRGIMIRLMPECTDGDTEDWYAIFNRLPLEDQNEMFLYYEYRDPENITVPSSEEDYSISVGRAGTATINEASGHLSIERSDIAISGNIMPAQISFAYNTVKAWRGDYKYYNAATGQLVSGETLSVPYGSWWLSNYNRFFFRTDEGETDAQYMFYDGSSVIPLSVSKDETGKWKISEVYTSLYNSRGYEFTVDIPENDTRAFHEIYDHITVRGSDGYLQKYDANGRLIKIYKEKYPNQSIDITYVSALAADNNFFAINSVTDGAKRKYAFSYTDGLLISVQCFASDSTEITAGSTNKPLKMTYGYTDNDLTSVIFPDEKTIRYTISWRDMSNMINIDGYTLVFSGTNDRITGYSERVTNSDGKNINGGSVTFSRNGNEVVISQDGKSVTKRFDNYGRPLLVIDENGSYSYYDYTNSVDDTPTVSAMRAAGGNLLTNGGFENGLQAWTAEGLTAADISAEYYNTGASSLQCIGAADTVKSVSQTVSDLVAGIYTLSAYVKASADTQVEETLHLTLTALSENGDVLKTEDYEITAPNTDFTQYTLTAELPSGTRAAKVCVQTDSTTGIFYIDDVQLEKSSYASDANYISNGNFQDGTNGWQTDYYLPTVNTTLNKKSVKAACLQTEIMESNTLQNTVRVNGKKDDVLVVGAWIDASEVLLNAPDYIEDLSREIDKREAFFAVEYTSTDENGKTQTQKERIDLQERMQDWIYLRHTLVLKGDCQNISVSFGLSGAFSNMNVAEVDVMKSGKIIPTPEEEIPEETPDTDESHFCICGSDCAYGYDCPCTCTSAETCTCDQCKGCSCPNCTEFRCECRCDSEEVCDCPQCKKKFDITYDEFGNLLSLKIMGKEIGEWLSMMVSRSYDTTGSYMTASTDENGQTIKYNYNKNNGMLQSMTDACGNLTEYTYDAVGALTQIKTPVSELTNLLSDDMITAYDYKNDRVSKIRHNDFSYNITYDAWGNVKSIYVGALDTALTIPFVEYTYGVGAYRSRIQKISFKNGNTIDYRYDGANITGVSYDGGKTYRYTYSYDELGYLTEIQDNAKNRVIRYNTDSVEVRENGALLYKAYTDSDGNFAEIINGTLFVTKQYDTQLLEETDLRSARTGVSVGDQELSAIAVTDKFGRKTEQSVLTRKPEDTSTPFAMVTAEYTYQQHTKGDENMAGSRIDTIKNTVKATGKADNSRYVFQYEYDENGNITHEYAVDPHGRTLTKRYTYDEANQLVRADDLWWGKTYVYTYNKGGNRIATKAYAYTLNAELGEVKSTVSALYLDPIWRDRMTSYNGKAIVYDSLGNPKSYDGNTYTWEGRQLKSISNANGKTEFTYDADGLRTETMVTDANGGLVQTDKYIWQDGRIVSHTLITPEKSETAKILYDSDNQPRGYILNDQETVLFVKNLQGDVVDLVDANGKYLVDFHYDAWGNMDYRHAPSITQEQANRYMKLCPMTYRGYNYDFTTGLYYLQSRYYNPEWGRFLNCDDTSILLATQGTDHGANLFAYCNNDPVNRVDYTGYWARDVHQGYEYSSNVKNGKPIHYKNVYIPAKYNRENGYTLYGTYVWAIQCGFSDYCAGIIGYHCNYVDSIFSPLKVEYQAMHFNTFRNTSIAIDSRILISIVFQIYATQYFDDALRCLNIGWKAKYIENRNLGLICLGFALHPIQDYYAHTDDVVHWVSPYWMHLPGNTDNPIKRWEQLIKTEVATKEILLPIYHMYRRLFT